MKNKLKFKKKSIHPYYTLLQSLWIISQFGVFFEVAIHRVMHKAHIDYLILYWISQLIN